MLPSNIMNEIFGIYYENKSDENRYDFVKKELEDFFGLFVLMAKNSYENLGEVEKFIEIFEELIRRYDKKSSQYLSVLNNYLNSLGVNLSCILSEAIAYCKETSKRGTLLLNSLPEELQKSVSDYRRDWKCSFPESIRTQVIEQLATKTAAVMQKQVDSAIKLAIKNHEGESFKRASHIINYCECLLDILYDNPTKFFPIKSAKRKLAKRKLSVMKEEEKINSSTTSILEALNQSSDSKLSAYAVNASLLKTMDICKQLILTVFAKQRLPSDTNTIKIEAVDFKQDALQNDKLYQSLWHAASTGQVDFLNQIERLSIPDFDINRCNDIELSAFLIAAGNHHVKFLKKLVQFTKIDTTVKDANDNTALHRALNKAMHSDTVEFLLSATTFDVNAVNRFGKSVLIHAIEKDSPMVAKLLEQPGINVNLTNKQGDTALSLLAKEGKLVELAQLITNPKVEVNFNHKNNEQQTPLMIAAAAGHIEIVAKLLALSDIDVVSRDEDNRSALDLATAFGHTDVAKVLVNYLKNTSDEEEKIHCCL